MKYPMLLTAHLRDYVWGGNRLSLEYGKETNLTKIAESWELSCHKDGESVIANGCYKGEVLSKVLNENKDFSGEIKFDKFPVLIKLIDANDKLSIQVHPNDEYAKENEDGEYGKTEVWYIVDAKENAKLIYGFNRNITKDEFKAAILNNSLQDILNFVPVKKGDVFFIPSGLVHAICDGILICEIQQNSNTTYRVYDWGRVDSNGISRELHIDKAIDVSRLTCEKNTDFKLKTEKIGNNEIGVISECEYFKTYKYNIDDEISIKCDEKSYHSLTFLEGNGTILMNEFKEPFVKGNTYFIPAGSGEYKITGKCELILSSN